MKDYSDVPISWPVPDKPLGGNGSPFASSTDGSAWTAFTNATKDANASGEDVISGSGYEEE